MSGRTLVLLLVAALAAGAAWAPAGGQDTTTAQPPEDARAELDATVAKIFTRSCATGGCHSGQNPKMQLDLSAEAIPASLVGVPSRQADEFMLIDTEDPARSYLLLKLTGGKGMKGKKMPIRAHQLSAEEMAAVSAWVAWFGGAKTSADTAVAPLYGPKINIHPLGSEEKKQ